jgi:3-hydroxybutyryl-CoA dehydrogenase
MGTGIAQVTAQSGFRTLLYDLDDNALHKAQTGIAAQLQSLVLKNKIGAGDAVAVLSNLQYTTDVNTCIADMVIEAVAEKTPVKTALFNQLAAINAAYTIFASNTSSLSVSAIAANIIHPERVIGMHFFNPAPVMKLVEVVKAVQTKDTVVDETVAVVKQMGKTPVICKDAPGFIVNHVARHYYLESLKLAENGIAGFADIDSLLEATGFKMGPFRLMDLIGNDINYAVSNAVYEAMNRPERLKPSVLQHQKVEKGELGRKTGKGYYDYTSGR